jgi:photosynthetic reaction center cytochrome c subunit
MLVPILIAVLLFSDAMSIAPLAQDPPPPPVQTAPAAQRNPMIVRIEQEIAGKEQLPAEQVFKNIQTFKGMPAGRVLSIMEQAFVPNLGVRCNYCHVAGEWASDEKAPKKIAREMWVLRAKVQEEARTASGNPKAVVTCYTCHKGQPKPAFAPEK